MPTESEPSSPPVSSEKANRRSEHDPLRPGSQSLELYRMCWELEAWLRQMVYVELRARDASWETEVARVVGKTWPPSPMARDKQLRHMATEHQSALSYLSTGQILNVIRNNWSLFEQYLPPRSIFDARVAEIEQIRHRVAHFRVPNERDMDRLSLFLRDLDKGVWRFCTSYSGVGDVLPPGMSDPVAQHFDETHDRRQIVEMQAISTGWRYANVDRMRPALGFYLRYSVRPWAKLVGSSLCGLEGVVYRARFGAGISSYESVLPATEILRLTEAVHCNCIHVRVERHHAIEITVPSILGSTSVIDTIERFLDACCGSVRRGGSGEDVDVERVLREWPEYVLAGDHPLGFLSEEMPCAMFDIACRE